MPAGKILKVGNSRALVLDKTITAAFGIEADTTQIPITIEDGRVIISAPTTEDGSSRYARSSQSIPEAEARKIATAAVAAVRPKAIQRWKAANQKAG